MTVRTKHRRLPGAMNCPRRGFTLLEMLAAIVITGIVAGVLYASLAIAFNARDAATQAVDQTNEARAAAELIRNDFAGVLPPTGVLAGAFIGRNETGDSGRDADEISYYTNNSLMPAADPLGDLKYVTICLADPDSVDDSPNATKLVRLVTTDLLATEESDPASQTLAQRIVSFNARYFDGTDWLDEWDSGQQDNMLPAAVDLTFQLLPQKLTEQEAEQNDELITLRQVVRLMTGTTAAQRNIQNAGG